jgi:transcriptional regulator with AAA-type ATPase domain
MNLIDAMIGGTHHVQNVNDGLIPLDQACVAAFGVKQLILVDGVGFGVTKQALLPLCPSQARPGKRAGDLLCWRWQCARPEDPLPHEPPRAFTLRAGERLLTCEPGSALVVGRSKLCHVVLDDASVAEFHGVLKNGPRGLAVFDLGSTHGTAVDGIRVEAGSFTACARIDFGKVRVEANPHEARPQNELIPLPSAPMQKLYSQVSKIARADSPVFITGESGVGKEGVARALHDQSGRRGRFVALNASVLSKNLAGSELFGHVRGAFTGAERDHDGAFVMADGGTLFLDEIADMHLDVQAGLLRVIEERQVRPLGSCRSRPVDVRLVTASHVDLRDATSSGRFRNDLYYRICVLFLEVAPLRDRAPDIEALADHFLQQKGRGHTLTAAARERLTAYAWPGNVRELRNAVERACLLCETSAIDVDHISLGIAGSTLNKPDRLSEVIMAFAAERSAYAAAARLQMHPSTVYRYLERAGLSPHKRRLGPCVNTPGPWAGVEPSIPIQG